MTDTPPTTTCTTITQEEKVLVTILDSSFDAGFLIFESSSADSSSTAGTVIYSNEAAQQTLTQQSSCCEPQQKASLTQLPLLGPCIDDLLSFDDKERKSWKEVAPFTTKSATQWKVVSRSSTTSHTQFVSGSLKVSKPMIVEGTGTFWTAFLRPDDTDSQDNNTTSANTSNDGRVLFSLPKELLSPGKNTKKTDGSVSEDSSISDAPPQPEVISISESNNNPIGGGTKTNRKKITPDCFSTATVLEQQQKRDENIAIAAFECALDPIFQINEHGTIQMVNHAATTIFGYEREEFLGHNIHMIIGEQEHASKHDQYIQNYMKTGVAKVIGKNRRLLAKTKDNIQFEIELGVVEVDTFLDDTEDQPERLFCGYVKKV